MSARHDMVTAYVRFRWLRGRDVADELVRHVAGTADLYAVPEGRIGDVLTGFAEVSPHWPGKRSFKRSPPI